MSEQPVIRIVQNERSITLDLRAWKWKPDQPDDEDCQILARLANLETRLYRLSPADGFPGCLLASQIAEKASGKVELTNIPQGEKDTVY